MKINNKGFISLETFLIVMVLVIIGGAGYFVYQAQSKTKQTLDQVSSLTEESASPHKNKTTTSSDKNYFTIKEWGIRAPYGGDLQLVYVLRPGSNQQYADFTSQQLLALDPECSAGVGGGLVGRYTISDDYMSGTVKEFLAVAKPSDYSHIGNYYYIFTHTQSACGSDIDATKSLQMQTNDEVKALVSKLEAIPQ